MIKKLITRLLTGKGKNTASSLGKRVEAGVNVHGIDPRHVDRRAAEVVHTLQQAGFEAYIVGGAVRDLLLGLRPKDFDVATDATPEEVKRLFRRAFIIGKRFRIVHVVYGRGREHEVIEVSTFRAQLDSAQAQQVHGNERTHKRELASVSHAVDASGRVLRDNVWGPQDEDAARRDFTINAMYYDPETQVVVDYHHGIQDAKKRVLRMIGDPALRYREDPVRIIRAVRFAAKLSGLGFEIETHTRAPLAASVALLSDVPQSRMFDEMMKLLQTGHASASVEQLRRLKLKGIYPLLDLAVERADDPMAAAVYADTDRRVSEGKPVAPSFLLACLLWSDVHRSYEKRLAGSSRTPAMQALHEAIDEVFETRVGDVSGRGRLGSDMREIWLMQPRFDRRGHHSALTLVEQPRFRAGFDFMRLRSLIGEVDEDVVIWWEAFSMGDEDHRRDMIEAVRLQQQSQRGSRTHRVAADGAPEQAADAEGATKKRRRRRRKPNGKGGGSADAAPSGSQPSED